MTKLLAGLPILALGFFSMASQALLFREHLLAGGGGDPGLAVFLGAWLCWMALGAGLDALLRPSSSWLPVLLPLYFLLALPVALGLWQLKALAGLSPLDPLGLPGLLLWSLPLLAPLPLLGGLLLPLAGRCFSQHPAFAAHPGATVYLLEVLGAVLGGAAVTLAQHLGLGATILLPLLGLLSFALALPLLAWRPFRLPFALGGALLLAGSLAPLLPQAQTWLAARRHAFVPAPLAGAAPLLSKDSAYSTWTVQLQPPGAPTEPAGLLVYRDGRFFHRYPETQDSSLGAAALLALHPKADSALVLGFGGEELVCRFLEAGLSRVTLLGADPVFASFVGSRLDPALRACLGDPRVTLLVGEPQALLPGVAPASVDLLVLALGDPDSAASARFLMPAFLAQLKGLLTPQGLLHLDISSTEATLQGPALAYARAVRKSLGEVFPFVTLGAGERLPFFASTRPLEQAPEALKAALLSRPKRPQGSPDALYLLFEEGPVQRRSQALALAPGQPLAEGSLARLRNLLAAEASGSPGLASLWGQAQRLLLLWLVLPFALLWVFALPGGRTGATLLQARLLLVFAGAGALVANLLLLLAYGFAFGSLPVDFGVLSALFMLGLAGASLGLRRLGGLGGLPRWLTPQTASVLALLALPLALLAMQVEGPVAGRLALGLALLLAGLLLGLPVPLLTAQGALGAAVSGRELALTWALDNLGGLLGAFLGGLVLLPVLGLEASGAAFALPLLAVALMGLPAVLPGGAFLARRAPAGPLPGLLRVLLILALALAAQEGYLRTRPAAPEAAVGTTPVTGPATLTPAPPQPPKEPQWRPKTRPILHRCLEAQDGSCLAYRLSSASAVPEVEGFGGRLSVALELDGQGLLRRVDLEEHNETPSYLTRLEPWLRSLEGLAALGIHLPGRPGEGPQVDGMTGSTVTSAAVLRAVDGSARALLGDQGPGAQAPQGAPQPPEAPKAALAPEVQDPPPLPPPPNQRQRRLDEGALRLRLDKGELSDREALFYR